MMEAILNIILGASSGFLGLLLFYSSRRKKERISASKSEFEALKEELSYLSDRLDKVREENRKLRDDFVALKHENMEYKILIIELKKDRCTDYSCAKRNTTTNNIL